MIWILVVNESVFYIKKKLKDLFFRIRLLTIGGGGLFLKGGMEDNGIQRENISFIEKVENIDICYIYATPKSKQIFDLKKYYFWA